MQDIWVLMSAALGWSSILASLWQLEILQIRLRDAVIRKDGVIPSFHLPFYLFKEIDIWVARDIFYMLNLVGCLLAYIGAYYI